MWCFVSRHLLFKVTTRLVLLLFLTDPYRAAAFLLCVTPSPFQSNYVVGFTFAPLKPLSCTRHFGLERRLEGHKQCVRHLWNAQFILSALFVPVQPRFKSKMAAA